MGQFSTIKTLSKSKFFKNVVAMVSGTSLAQLLPLAVSPILTRYYTDADFGVMGSITSISAILAVGISGRYQLAIMLPKSNQKAYSLSVLSISIAIIASLILLVLALVFPQHIETLIGIEGISKWLIYIPFTVFFIGVWNTLNIWVSRAENFKINATSKIIQSSSNAGISVFFSKLSIFYFSVGGMIIGRIGGFAISSFNMLWYYVKDIKTYSLRFNFKEIKSLAIEYKEYPKYNLLPAILDAFSLNALILVIGKYYSVSNLGYFSLTNFSLIAPVSLISLALRDILYQRFTKIVHNGDSPLKFYLKSAKWLAIIGLPVLIVPLIWGPSIYSFVFGFEWKTSGEMAGILSVTYWIKLVVSPLSSIFNSTNKIRIASYWQLLYSMTTLVVLSTSVILELEIHQILYVYAIHEVLLYSSYFILGVLASKKEQP